MNADGGTEELTREIKREAKARGWTVDTNQLVKVELVLTLLGRVAPQQPAAGAWALLRLPVRRGGRRS